ncbi:MAG: hypothetical protein ACRC5T_12650, partial [Cetobacterium sp.]
KYNIVLEKFNGRNFVYFKTFTGAFNGMDGSIEFEKCFIEDVEKKNEYRIYLEMYEGGMIVFNGKQEPINISIVGECADFDIDVTGAKKIGEIFELSSTNESEVEIQLNIKDKGNYNTLTASVYVDYKEMDKPIFEPVVVNGKKFIVKLSDVLFENNDSNIYVVLKDALGNQRQRIFAICKPESARSFFYSITEEVLSNIFTDEVNLRFESRNCQSLIPVIKNEKYEIVSEKIIGMRDKNQGVLSFKLSDYFEDRKWKNMELRFKVNQSEVLSNVINIGIDNNEPFVLLDNFDDEGYRIIKEDKTEITGTISDENFFFVGEASLKCDFIATMYTHIIEGKDFDEVWCGEDLVSFIKYEKFSIVSALGEIDIYKNGTRVYPKKITDFDERKFFISVVDFDNFTTYEKNIIANQGGLSFIINERVA